MPGLQPSESLNKTDSRGDAPGYVRSAPLGRKRGAGSCDLDISRFTR